MVDVTAVYIVAFLTLTCFGCQVCLIQGTITGNCSSPLGMTNGRIKDTQLTASSFYKYFKITISTHQEMKPKYGRLNHVYAWCTDQSQHSWLTVDLRRSTIVTGIASQGFKNVFNHYYVKEYQLQFSMDGKTWKHVTRNGGIKKFDGNKHADDTVRNNFAAVQARYIKVMPITYKYRICMRIELYGCYNDTTAKDHSIQTSTGIPTTLQITNAQTSQEPTRKTATTTVSTNNLTATQNAVKGKTGNKHGQFSVNVKSSKMNFVILGCSIVLGVATLAICVVIAVSLVRKRRKRRSGQFENCNEVADNDFLYLKRRSGQFENCNEVADNDFLYLKRRSGQFENCNEVADNDFLYLDDELPCLNSYDDYIKTDSTKTVSA